jgi:hypothetical protein
VCSWIRKAKPGTPLYETQDFLSSVEGWYAPEQLALLASLVSEFAVKHSVSCAVEIGCWAGRSTAVLSQALPRRAELVCVDHWGGQISEGSDHPTVQRAADVDVYAIFQRNMQRWARPNWRAMRLDSVTAALTFTGVFQVLHIDGGHHYQDVRGDLDAWLPKADRSSLICGDDWLTAHQGRADLDGGVQRAVRERLGEPRSVGNLWFVERTS